MRGIIIFTYLYVYVEQINTVFRLAGTVTFSSGTLQPLCGLHHVSINYERLRLTMHCWLCIASHLLTNGHTCLENLI